MLRRTAGQRTCHLQRSSRVPELTEGELQQHGFRPQRPHGRAAHLARRQRERTSQQHGFILSDIRNPEQLKHRLKLEISTLSLKLNFYTHFYTRRRYHNAQYTTTYENGFQ